MHFVVTTIYNHHIQFLPLQPHVHYYFRHCDLVLSVYDISETINKSRYEGSCDINAQTMIDVNSSRQSNYYYLGKLRAFLLFNWIERKCEPVETTYTFIEKRKYLEKCNDVNYNLKVFLNFRSLTCYGLWLTKKIRGININQPFGLLWFLSNFFREFYQIL